MVDRFTFERRARGAGGLAMLGGWVSLLAFMALVVSAAWWILALLTLLALPAAIEVITDRRATLTLTPEAVSWTSGRRGQSVPLADIAEVILSTTFDLSQRGKLKMTDGRTVRLPPDCLPPGRRLDAELTARGVAHRRSLFGT